MKIGIDLSSLDKSSFNQGVYTYAMGLLDGFKKINKKSKFQIYINENVLSHFQNKLDKKIFEIIIIKKKFFFLKKIITFLVLIFGFLGIKIYSVHFYLINLLNHKIKETFEKNSDIIIFLNAHENCYNLKIKTIINFHDIIHKTLPNYLKKQEKLMRDVIYYNCAKSSNFIVASSASMKKEFTKHMNIERKKIYVINEGVDEYFIKKINTKKSINNNYLFYPAQFWKHKNHKTLIYEFNNFKQMNKSNLKLFLCGKKKSYFKEVKNYIYQNKVKDVNYLGQISQMRLINYYQNSFAVVMPSLYESSSLVLLEAICLKKIMIASNIGPNKELAKIFKIYLFNPHKKNDLSNKIKKVTKLKSTTKRKIVNNNYLKIRSYSWQNVAIKYNKLIKKYDKIW